MQVANFIKVLDSLGGNFYAGVPDSLLSPFTDYIIDTFGVSQKHVVTANEGAAVGLAAGHYLATGHPAVVYMQNSGLGNAVNPICSLLHQKVYKIPTILVIGWRGEPGTKDEPQHIFQGECTLSLLECMEIPYVVISKDNDTLSTDDLSINEFRGHIENGQTVAFVISKDALKNGNKVKFSSDAELSREKVLDIIAEESGADDVFVCTTGKLSREMFELREQKGTGHGQDFLTVGSMGHSLMIAYGISLSKPNKRVFCLDGDGAVLMHMGSLAIVGANNPPNIVHVVINNGAHETVGGIPTVASHIKLSDVAASLGYEHTFCIATEAELKDALSRLANLSGAVFIEVICNLHSRYELGRPTSTPIQNKNDFMKFLAQDTNGGGAK